MATDAEFLTAFEAKRWPFAQWHHRDHIRLAYLYLIAHPFAEAADRIRAGIKAHNAANNRPESLTAGYHETMTMAWLHLVAAALRADGPAESAEAFCEAHPELLDKHGLLKFYSKGHLLSAEAKAGFVEADLVPLPEGT